MKYILAVPGIFLLLLSLRYWSRAGDLYFKIIQLGWTSSPDDLAEAGDMTMLKKSYYIAGAWAMLFTIATGIYFAVMLFAQGR